MGISYEFKIAYSILFRVFYKKDRIEPILSALSSPYGKKSIQRITDLTYGVARYSLYLDTVIKKISRIDFEKIEREVLLILKIAIYQLLLNPVRPEYSVVDEAVEFAKKIKKENSAKFINAILRKIIRKPQIKKEIYSFGPPEERLAIKYSHPIFLIEKWIKAFGNLICEEILIENQKIPKIDLLVNIKNISLKEMKEILLKNKIIAEESKYSPAGLKIIKGNIRNLPQEIKKNFYVMDLTAQSFSYLFAQLKGNFFVDLASAPGGKGIAISLFHKYKVHISSDLILSRILKVKRNFQNFNGKTKLLVQDILNLALKKYRFDRVLLDAPCSGTGVLRKNPEAKWRLSFENFKEYKNKQKKLLSSALNLLSPGGLLFYITCSIEKEENEEVVMEILEEREGFEIFNDYKGIKNPILNFKDQIGFIKVLPQEELDGMTGVIIRKKEK